MRSRTLIIFLFCIFVAVGYIVALSLTNSSMTLHDRISSAGQLLVIPLLVGTCSSLLASWLLEEERSKFINKISAEIFSEVDENRKSTQKIISDILELLQQGKLNQATAMKELIPRLHEADKNLSKTPTADEFIKSLGKQRSF